MTEPVIRDKWRPSLSMIVFTVLLTVMLMPLVGLFLFRLYENQLIRQTEGELIAQSAALSAVFSGQVRDRLPSGIGLGAVRPADARPVAGEPYAPIVPSLDLASDDLRERRPDALVTSQNADPQFVEIGRQVFALTKATQRVTLAGFRVLDPSGIVIGGREEVGRSLAHIAEVAAALKGRYSSVLRTRISDEPPPPLYSISRGTGVRVFVAYPVIVDEKVAGVIYASRTPSNVVKHLYQERGKVIAAALSVIGITMIMGFIFLRMITRPIHGLIRYTEESGRGMRDTAYLPKHLGSREIAALAKSFTDMTSQLNDRADYIATFAAHVSHEIKSPLTAMKGAAELLRDSGDTMTGEERRRFLDNIINDTSRLTALLNRLRELAYADNPKRDGTTSLEEVATRLRTAFPGLSISTPGDVDTRIAMSLDNALMVFSHLADNASQHNAKEIELSVTAREGMARILATDNGDGISSGNQDRIFEPFFTTRRDDGGTGMGLGIARSILVAHGGTISLVPTADRTMFEIRIPSL